MAQGPLLVDQIQIEPGSTGTRLINRATDGSLQFRDPSITSVILQNMVGIRNVTGVYIVGQGGDGAPYTSIQEALDAIPDASVLPSLVLVLAGQYIENLTINKDVFLVGLGLPVIINAGAASTITIESTPTTCPSTVLLQNLVLLNSSNAQSCILLDGAGTYSSGTITAVSAPLAAGDTLTIAGNVLTGVAGTRTSGGDNFSVDGTTVGTIAAEIAEALNDSLNSFTADIVAEVSGAVVTITAQSPGVGGDAITLAVSTTPVGGLTRSGANLTGGSSSGSHVVEGGLIVRDCLLAAIGVGGFQIHADTVNNILVQGGSWRDSASTSEAWVSNCAAFRMIGVDWINHLELAYDTTADRPYTTTSEYLVSGCDRVGNVLCNLSGAGSLTLNQCSSVGDVAQTGDRTLAANYARLGALSLGATTVATLVNSTRTSVATASGTPTLNESPVTGTILFSGTAAETVTFGVPQPDAVYSVHLDCATVGSVPAVTAKTAGGFTATFSAPYTGTVYYTLMRQQ